MASTAGDDASTASSSSSSAAAAPAARKSRVHTAPQVELVVCFKGSVRSRTKLGPERIVVGTGDSCLIKLEFEHQRIAEQHCCLQLNAQKLPVVWDCGSKYATRLNDKELRAATVYPLAHGDKVHLDRDITILVEAPGLKSPVPPLDTNDLQQLFMLFRRRRSAQYHYWSNYFVLATQQASAGITTELDRKQLQLYGVTDADIAELYIEQDLDGVESGLQQEAYFEMQTCVRRLLEGKFQSNAVHKLASFGVHVDGKHQHQPPDCFAMRANLVTQLVGWLADAACSLGVSWTELYRNSATHCEQFLDGGLSFLVRYEPELFKAMNRLDKRLHAALSGKADWDFSPLVYAEPFEATTLVSAIVRWKSNNAPSCFKDISDATADTAELLKKEQRQARNLDKQFARWQLQPPCLTRSERNLDALHAQQDEMSDSTPDPLDADSFWSLDRELRVASLGETPLDSVKRAAAFERLLQTPNDGKSTAASAQAYQLPSALAGAGTSSSSSASALSSAGGVHRARSNAESGVEAMDCSSEDCSSDR